MASRELRLGLVLNGGVSLAIWIGGVTREIDAARRASTGEVRGGDTDELYKQILAALDLEVVVDVIAGASAGGINGVLLGTAIYNNTALDGLRETWLSLGDFRRLLRSPSLPDPPSLMKGDEVVLPELRRIVRALWRDSTTRPSHPLYLYVTATDLPGYAARFNDSYGDTINEWDHRRVFGFEYEHDPVDGTDFTNDRAKKMRLRVLFEDEDAPELLAQAARSSSSFPVAFEAHSLEIVGEQVAHPMVDGGILDNQPFNPVLDRVSVLPAERPVRRAIVYIVPYATSIGVDDEANVRPASARDTFSAASSLPRDLPKLQSLERVTRERTRQDAASFERQLVFADIEPEQLERAAMALFEPYKRVRFSGSQAVFELWGRPEFRPGGGVIAQHPADDPRDLIRKPDTMIQRRGVPWIPSSPLPTWNERDTEWSWGLSPAERAASLALLYFRDHASAWPDLLEERILASQLIARARAAKLAFRRAFRESAVEPHPAQSRVDVMTRAEEAYGTIRGRLRELQDDFRALDRGLRAETEHSVQSLLHLEVARGACLADGSSPAPFQFLFASARVQNSLGHQARMPNEKLAGLQLGHFGGFLKRSWRANDWLWGRMDGIEHLMRVILDEGTVTSLTPAQRTQLAALAFPDPEHARPDEIEALETRWNTQRASINISGAHAGARTEFAALLADQSSPHRTLACQQALAARLELRVLREDLRRIAETAADDLASGSSRISAGAFWSNRFPLERASPPDDQLVALFKDMDVGKEAVKDETSSRLVLDVSAQTAAVAAAVFAGDRGGLPTIARSALGTIRAASLAVSRLVRLLAREPWVGAAVVAVLIGLLVWAAVAKNTLLGALLPALALLVVAGLLSLLTIATSVFEQSVTTVSRIAGFTLFAGIPIGFFFATRGFHWDHRGVHWFDAHTGEQATSIAAAAAAVAGTAAVARVVFGAFVTLARRAFGAKPGHGWIRTVLLIYRAAVIAALGSLVVGFIIERTLNRHPGPGRWVAVADEKRGTLLIILLLAVLVTAALIEELAAWVRRAIRTLALALKHW